MPVFKIVFPNNEVSDLINISEDKTMLELKDKILNLITNDKLKTIIKDDFNLRLYLPPNNTYFAEGMDPCQPDTGTHGAIFTPIMLRRKIKDLNRYFRIKCNDDSYMLFLTSKNYDSVNNTPENIGSFFGSKKFKKSKKSKSKKSKSKKSKSKKSKSRKSRK